MSRYYFDIHDGVELCSDELGVECLVDRVREEALRILPNLAREALPADSAHDIWVRVRDEEGNYIFEARLKLTSTWLNSLRDRTSNGEVLSTIRELLDQIRKIIGTRGRAEYLSDIDALVNVAEAETVRQLHLRRWPEQGKT